MKDKSFIENLHETANNYNKQRFGTLVNHTQNLMVEAASKGEFFTVVILEYEDKSYISSIIDHFEGLGFKVVWKGTMEKPSITIDWRRLPKNK